MKTKILALALALAAVSVLTAACGSSTPSASEKVCSAKTTLQHHVDALQTDVKNGNFGQARSDLTAIGNAFDDLTQETRNLASEQAQALQPQIDSLQSGVSNLTKAQSLDQLRNGLRSIGSQLQALSSQVTNTLTCS